MHKHESVHRSNATQESVQSKDAKHKSHIVIERHTGICLI